MPALVGKDSLAAVPRVATCPEVDNDRFTSGRSSPVDESAAVPAKTVLDVAFPFTAEIIAPRCRNSEERSFSERTSVVIAEAGREEFVPALRLKESHLRYYFSEEGAADPERTLYGYRDALWAPVLDNNFNLLTPKQFSKALALSPNGAGLRYRSPFWFLGEVSVESDAYRPRVPSYLEPDVKPYDPQQVRKVVCSDYEARQADAQRVADSMRVVDGKLYFRCREPFWASEVTDTKARLLFGGRLDPTPETPWLIRLESFRADRIEEMKDWRRRYRASFARKTFKLITETDGEVEILDGTFFRRDDLEETMAGIKFTAEAAFAFMKHAPKETTLDWLDFRDRAAALADRWSRPAALEVLEAMVKVSSYAASVTDPGPGFSAADWEVFRSRWRNHCQRLKVRARWFENARTDLSEADLASLHELSEAISP